jgi:hypothetical protein
MLSTEYIAGLYDARGTFCIFKMKTKKGSIKERPYIAIHLRFEESAVFKDIKEWAEGLGVNLSLNSSGGNSAFAPKSKERARLIAYDSNAIRLCHILLPFLRVKREQAEGLITHGMKQKTQA